MLLHAKSTTHHHTLTQVYSSRDVKEMIPGRYPRSRDRTMAIESSYYAATQNSYNPLSEGWHFQHKSVFMLEYLIEYKTDVELKSTCASNSIIRDVEGAIEA